MDLQIGIIWVLVLCIISAVGAIFIYRNNRDLFSPFADKIDKTHDSIKSLLLVEIEKLRQQIKKLEDAQKKQIADREFYESQKASVIKGRKETNKTGK